MRFAREMIALAVLAVAATDAAWADHGHGHGHVRLGVVIGPYWGPWYYPPAYYYPPYYPVVVERTAPPVYIEQQSAAPAMPPPAAAPAAQNNYWYYCNELKGYYPYVKECPGGWQKVSPQPPGLP